MKVIGVDVDGTLVPHTKGKYDPRKVAPPTASGRRLLELLYEKGYTVCIWSCRATYVLCEWLVENNLQQYVDYVNSSPLPADDRKLAFHYYIGDDAVQHDCHDDPENLINFLSWQDYPDFGEWDKTFSSRTPPLYLRGVGDRFLGEFGDNWRGLWPNRTPQDYCLLTICSHAKPYYKSHIHMRIREELWHAGFLDRMDYAHISSAGIIPTDNGNEYPYDSYDWDNREATEETLVKLRDKLFRDLSHWKDKYAKKYKRVIVYLRKNGNTARVTERVMGEDALYCLAPEEQLPYAFNPDPDDCLVTNDNLVRLVRTFVVADQPAGK